MNVRKNNNVGYNEENKKKKPQGSKKYNKLDFSKFSYYTKINNQIYILFM